MKESTTFKQFHCETIDKALLSMEWKKWLRSLKLYLDAEEISNVVKKKNKLLHLGGPQLQEVAFGIPGAITEYDPEKKNDVFQTLVEALDKHFSPQQNSSFERHSFRLLKPEEGENFNKYLVKCRAQAKKCVFGSNEKEAHEINLKDKLIDSWAHLELKRKLLEKELSLEEVIELCQIHEQTQNQTNIMQNSTKTSEPTTINRIAGYKRKVTETRNDSECTRCGRLHSFTDLRNCPASNSTCFYCGRLGHFSRKCRERYKKQRPMEANFNNSSNNRNFTQNTRKINYIEKDTSQACSSKDDLHDFECFKVGEEKGDELITLKIGGIDTEMLIDSGASKNIINGGDWRKLTEKCAAVWDIDQEVPNKLMAYASKQPLNVTHKFTAPVSVNNGRELITSFLVVEEGTISLLGKQTAQILGVLKLGINATINQIENFKPFPKIKNIKVKLTINPNIKPIQQPVRRIPIAVEAQVESKLEEAIRSDIIERVDEPSSWISPVVVVFKPDGDIRICVDMRRANEAILRENFPLPTFENFMTKLRNAKFFSQLDLSNAYHQLELEEESRPITTFITHKGMFRYKRLMFGVNSAPEIFQRIFSSILARCKNCLNYLDDIIVFGTTEVEHDSCLTQVVLTLKNYNVQLNEKKCLRKVTELEFLGHILSAQGISPDPKKVNTIRNFRPPQNREELRSFLGLVTYLGKFIPDLGTLTEPLRKLTREDVLFNWESAQQNNFNQLKKELERLPTLSFFHPSKKTRLIADASPVALGAILIQIEPDNTPNVISYASKSLSPVERRYSQTEKESLALVWAVERFYFYLAGLEFELVTDHKPLEAIFKPTSKPPARIERWLLRLQAFRFKIIYQSGKKNIADPFSRLCRLEDELTFDEPNEHHIQTVIEKTIPKALSIQKIVTENKCDPQIQECLSKIPNNSWSPNDKSPFYPFRFELSNLGPILLRGNRIVIPTTLRNQILQLSHEGHPGETVMKRRLRSKVWWPQIDRDAEQHVKKCRDCLMVSQPNTPAPMTRKQLPLGPWQYISMDFMSGEPGKEHLLVLIDYYSRYHETIFMTSMTSTQIIRKLEEIFCRLGIPKTIKVDNATNLNSGELETFCEENGITITNSPPYWPQANGEVENMNKSIKKRLQIAFLNNNPDYKKEIMNFTLMYNTTPHGTTGKTPSELLFGRTIRDKIPALTDILLETQDEEAYDRDLVNKNKGKRREDEARAARSHDINIGDRVLVKNVVKAHKLVPNFGDQEYEVLTRDGNELTLLSDDGKILRRNVAHVKKTNSHEPEENIPTSIPNDSTLNDINTTPKMPPLKLVKRGGMWGPASEHRP